MDCRGYNELMDIRWLLALTFPPRWSKSGIRADGSSEMYAISDGYDTKEITTITTTVRGSTKTRGFFIVVFTHKQQEILMRQWHVDLFVWDGLDRVGPLHSLLLALVSRRADQHSPACCFHSNALTMVTTRRRSKTFSRETYRFNSELYQEMFAEDAKNLFLDGGPLKKGGTFKGFLVRGSWSRVQGRSSHIRLMDVPFSSPLSKTGS